MRNYYRELERAVQGLPNIGGRPLSKPEELDSPDYGFSVRPLSISSITVLDCRPASRNETIWPRQEKAGKAYRENSRLHWLHFENAASHCRRPPITSGARVRLFVRT